VQLVDIKGLVIWGLARFYPRAVAPFVAGEVVDLRRRLRAQLGMERIGVALLAHDAVFAQDGIFVGIIFGHAGHKGLPNPDGYFIQGCLSVGPAVKFPNHRHGVGVGCPNAESDTFFAVLCADVRTHKFVGAAVVALVE
jgi:hypothetical protein